MKRFPSFLFVSSLLLTGFIFGLVISGRLASLDAPFAAQTPAPAAPTAPSRSSAMPVTAGLPDLSPIAERALKVAANISSTEEVFSFFGGSQQAENVGSGVIVSADGYILTNNHVIQNASGDIRVTLPDAREVKGKVIGKDDVTDLAVVKVDATGLPTLPWGDSTQLRVAEWVLAVGNPFQFSKTVTLGIVSAVSRPGETMGAYNDLIQTDAAINPGNSGGALVDDEGHLVGINTAILAANSGGALVNSRGELIGINSMIYTETGGNTGIGFAIPSNLARQIMDELIKNGEIRWGSVGYVQWVTASADDARRAGYGPVAGVFVTRRMDMNSPAYRGGLRPGDIIVSINEHPVTSVEQLEGLIFKSIIGSTARVEVVRSSRPSGSSLSPGTLQHVTLSVPIVSRSQQAPRRGR
jgi:S1-C subfamily serine protease